MSLFKKILPPATIGIIGGGQLAKMLSQAAKAMGYKTIILDPSDKACSRGVCDEFLCAAYTDKEALSYLAKQTDVITYEFENIPSSAIEWLKECGAYVPQGYEVLAISQDRLLEKEKLSQAGFEVVPYKDVRDIASLEKYCDELGYPLILKTRSGGYDGKGQYVINSKDDIQPASKLLAVACILEKKIKFDKEVSIIGFKSVNNDFTYLPIGENVHKNSILHTTSLSQELSKALENKVAAALDKFYDLYQVRGILTIELFLVGDKLIANEIAPRPHNSGHWSQDGANFSQFELAILSICGLRLAKPELLQPTVMINLLGQHYDNLIKHIDSIVSVGKIHLYGKEGNAINRKIGHINIGDKDSNQLKEKVDSIEKLLNM